MKETKAWHSLSIDRTLVLLNASLNGLTSEQVARRLEEFGPNVIPDSPPKSLLKVYLHQFKNAFIYLLLIAAAISLFLRELGDALFIAAALQINAIIGTAQEWQAQEKAMALRKIVKSIVVVRRDGAWKKLDGRDLVPGDIIEVEAGTRIPAALRLVKAETLEVDESLLTGESVPVLKETVTHLPEETSLADQYNMVHAGTTALRGRALGVVVATGPRTELGKVAESLLASEQVSPPLIGQMEKFTRNIAGLVVGIIALIAIAELLRGIEPSAILMMSVALAVAVIPEGLPVALTVALAISVSRMSKRNVIVRKLAAVEGLGACTMIAADKTGTLTVNELSVERIYTLGLGDQSVSTLLEKQNGFDPAALGAFHRLVIAGLLCNEARLQKQRGGVSQLFGDTVDGALLKLGENAAFDLESIERDNPRTGRIQYEPTNSFAASFHEGQSGLQAFVKGAAEVVLPFCMDQETEEITSRVEAFARKGYRVLALAEGIVAGTTSNDLKNLNFLGLVALIDPLRPNAAQAVHRCRGAGVIVSMITGDHPLTALEIGRKLDMVRGDEDVVTGPALANLENDQSAFDSLVAQTLIFARIAPLQKLAIVQSMQRSGHVVAVTGDGVNDAAAIAAADIGAAMGRTGTDVARSAADLIIADDELSSLAAGIEEGRIAYDNIRKVIYLLISTGAAELVLFLASIASGLPLPLSPVQLLWLNLVTQGIQDVALAFEKGEPAVLNRQPRPSKEGIVNRQMVEQTVLSGLFVGGVAFLLFRYYLNAGLDPFDASNRLLLVLILFENAHVFNCRSETRSVFVIPILNNPFLVGGVAVVQLIHLTAMHILGLNRILDIQPLPLETWAWSALLALSVILFMEFYKIFLRVIRK